MYSLIQVRSGLLMESGSYLLLESGGKIILDHETGATAYRMAYDAGGGMFQAVGLGLSSYIKANGIYKFVAKDCSGNEIVFYGASACGGETLGSEELIDGDMETDPTNNWDSAGSTLAEETTEVYSGSKALEVTLTSNGGCADQSIMFTDGKVYKYSSYGKSNVSGDRWRITVKNESAGEHLVLGSWVDNTSYSQQTVYCTGRGNTCAARLQGETDGEVVYFDDATLKQVTDLPTTAIKMESAPGAGDGDYVSKNSGFDPNDVCSFDVWKYHGGGLSGLNLDIGI